MASVNVIFQPGDQVQVAPPPPPAPEPVMTVITTGISEVECEWYVNGSRQTGWFKPATLHLVIPAVLPKS